jgi:hypothetical protein
MGGTTSSPTGSDPPPPPRSAGKQRAEFEGMAVSQRKSTPAASSPSSVVNVRKVGKKGAHDVIGSNEMSEVRSLKRRASIAEETVRIKKERIDEAEQEYEEEHRTFTNFSQQLAEKWEQRFDALAQLARDAGVRHEDIEALRTKPWQQPEVPPTTAKSTANSNGGAGPSMNALTAEQQAEVDFRNFCYNSGDDYYWGWPEDCYDADGAVEEDLPTLWRTNRGDMVLVNCANCRKMQKRCNCERDFEAIGPDPD